MIVPLHTRIPVITPSSHPVWQERSWKREQLNGTDVYTGKFKIKDIKAAKVRVFQGSIHVKSSGIIDAWVCDIPPELYPSTGSHPKHLCFRLDDAKSEGGSAWFNVHWRQAPKDPNTAIIYLESVLFEAINHTW